MMVDEYRDINGKITKIAIVDDGVRTWLKDDKGKCYSTYNFEPSLKNLTGTMKMVDEVLEKFPAARDSDEILFAIFYKEFYGITEKDSFFSVMKMVYQGALPVTVSIRRARQKLQEQGRWEGKRKRVRKEYEEVVREQIKEMEKECPITN